MRLLAAFLVLGLACAAQAKEVTLLNASYDPTRELFAEYNRHFADQWHAKTGEKLRVRMAHGASGKQARAVMEGLPAEVVTLALGYDIDAIARAGRLREDWREALPHHAAPYRSTVVLLVRKGNPKQIHDWDDLARPDVQVLTPNPKSSGGARWNYLAAWAYAEKNFNKKGAHRFMKRWIGNVLLFDTGARASTTNFVRRARGDVLITWENEAYVAQKYFGADAFEIVMPSVTVLAEPPVAVVDAVVDKNGTRELAEAYLQGLYTPAAQAMAAKHHFRPAKGGTPAGMPSLSGVTVKTVRDFGGWDTVQQKHFAEGGLFDEFSGAVR